MLYPAIPHEEDIDTSHYQVQQLIDMGIPEKQAISQVKFTIEMWRKSDTITTTSTTIESTQQTPREKDTGKQSSTPTATPTLD